jgi:hypothetical protein
MGRTESVSLNLGVKIKIKDLLEVIDEDNHESIRDDFFKEESLIDDENGFYHGTLVQIADGYVGQTDYIDPEELDHKEYKKHMIKVCKSYGDSAYNNCGAFPCEEDDPKNLYHQYLLVPFYEFVENKRHGHHREGSNGASCEVDLEELDRLTKKIHEKMKKLKIEKYKVTFNICQYGG